MHVSHFNLHLLLLHNGEVTTGVLISPYPDPTEKKTIERSPFFSDAEVIAAAETWLDGQPPPLLSLSLFFLGGGGLQTFGRCSWFPSWSVWLISIQVLSTWRRIPGWQSGFPTFKSWPGNRLQSLRIFLISHSLQKCRNLNWKTVILFHFLPNLLLTNHNIIQFYNVFGYGQCL